MIINAAATSIPNRTNLSMLLLVTPHACMHFRVTGVEFKKMGYTIDFPNLLADLAFKIIFGGDEQALRLLMRIGSNLKPTAEGRVYTKSKYSYPKLKSEDEAWKHYDDVLRIILSYQNRIPRSKWRKLSELTKINVE